MRFIFQPAEEIMKGAKFMIKRGCLKGVSQVWGFHNRATDPKNELLSTPGPFLAGSGKVSITASVVDDFRRWSALADFCGCPNNKVIYGKIKEALGSGESVHFKYAEKETAFVYLCRVSSTLGNFVKPIY